MIRAICKIKSIGDKVRFNFYEVEDFFLKNGFNRFINSETLIELLKPKNFFELQQKLREDIEIEKEKFQELIREIFRDEKKENHLCFSLINEEYAGFSDNFDDYYKPIEQILEEGGFVKEKKTKTPLRIEDFDREALRMNKRNLLELSVASKGDFFIGDGTSENPLKIDKEELRKIIYEEIKKILKPIDY